MSNELNRTIHANDQIRAAVDEWLRGTDLELLRLEATLANELANASPVGRLRMYYGLAAIYLVELIERKEREQAGVE